MNPSAPHPHRRRLTRAEVRRRRRNRAIRRVAGLTVMLCVAVGGVSFLLTAIWLGGLRWQQQLLEAPGQTRRAIGLEWMLGGWIMLVVVATVSPPWAVG